MGFKILGTNAAQAVPALMRIYERDLSPHSQYWVGRALVAIGPESIRTAIPWFLRATTSTNAGVRENAVWVLANAHTEAALVVPALVKSLNDSERDVRESASFGLAGFGVEAQPAVPALVLLLKHAHSDVRIAATNALKAIDPEAAAKAGVK